MNKNTIGQRLGFEAVASSHAVALSSFWPSRRLWLKLILALFLAPSFPVGFLLLLMEMFAGAVGWGGSNLNSLGWLALNIMVIGPVAMGLELTRWLRGLSGGCLSVVMAFGCIIIPTFFGGGLGAFFEFGFVIAGAQILILEMATGDVKGGRGLTGLGTGLVVGLLIATAFSQVTNPEGSDLGIKVAFLWSIPASLVWISVIVVPELITKRVGWGGVLVWVAFVLLLFSIGLVLRATM